MGQDTPNPILSRPKPLDRPIRLMVIAGTRPEAIKVAPIVLAARANGDFDVRLVASGQHPRHMLEAFGHFGLEPDINLDIFKVDQTLTTVTSNALTALSCEIERERPDVVVVQGDTSTAFAGALAAYYHQVPVAHVEAGLRSYNIQNPFPEEANRKMIDTIASFIFPPTDHARANLEHEGVTGDHVFVTGNTVVDSLQLILSLTSHDPQEDLASHYFDSAENGWHAGHVLITAHRRESWGSGLDSLARGIGEAAKDLPDHLFYAPLHPNPLVRKSFQGLPENVLVGEPLPYPVFLRAIAAADVIVTDSGGATEEAVALGKHVVVAREETERPEAVDAGRAQLVGTHSESITRAVHTALGRSRQSDLCDVFGDGRSSIRIVEWLSWHFGCSTTRPRPFVPRESTNVSNLDLIQQLDDVPVSESADEVL